MELEIGRIRIEDQRLEILVELLEPELDQQILHGRKVALETFVALVLAAVLGAQFEPVERRLAGQWSVFIPLTRPRCARRVRLADGGRQRRVDSEFVVVVEVLVAQRQAEDALSQELLERVLHPSRVAMIGEAGGGTADNVVRLIELSKQKRASIRGDISPVKVGRDATAGKPPIVTSRSYAACWSSFGGRIGASAAG